jgi:hypothetical protein
VDSSSGTGAIEFHATGHCGFRAAAWTNALRCSYRLVASVSSAEHQTRAEDDQQEQTVAVLLVDASRSGAGADRVPADSSLSSHATARRGCRSPLQLAPREQSSGMPV